MVLVQYLIRIWPVFEQRGSSIWSEFDQYLTNEDPVFDQNLTSIWPTRIQYLTSIWPFPLTLCYLICQKRNPASTKLQRSYLSLSSPPPCKLRRSYRSLGPPSKFRRSYRSLLQRSYTGVIRSLTPVNQQNSWSFPPPPPQLHRNLIPAVLKRKMCKVESYFGVLNNFTTEFEEESRWTEEMVSYEGYVLLLQLSTGLTLTKRYT